MTRINMKSGLRRAGASLFSALLVLALSFALALSVPCAFAETPAESRYTNPYTGYDVVILDEDDLLSDAEEERLVEDMVPVTEYGNVAFWSINERTRNEIDQARMKRKELFDYSSATIFAINMANRKLTIQSYGTLYEGITDSIARSITDNVSSFATKNQYYTAAQKCYSQIYDVMDGSIIPEPMKLTSYAVLSIILGFTIILAVAFSSRFNPLRAESEEIKGLWGEGTPGEPGEKDTISEVEISASSGGSGGGGCGGGGCGGGGCGGGGSSGF